MVMETGCCPSKVNDFASNQNSNIFKNRFFGERQFSFYHANCNVIQLGKS